MKAKKMTLETPREGMLDITASVRQAVTESGVTDGLCVVYCPHTTGGITINENADPDVKRDLLLGWAKTYPDRPEFRHMEGNTTAHLKCSAVGPSQTVLIEDGRMILGTWQGIYFCEFDGPRRRSYYVKVIQG